MNGILRMYVFWLPFPLNIMFKWNWSTLLHVLAFSLLYSIPLLEYSTFSLFIQLFKKFLSFFLYGCTASLLVSGFLWFCQRWLSFTVGFSLWWLLMWRSTGSRCAGLVVHGTWNLPRPGVWPVSRHWQVDSIHCTMGEAPHSFSSYWVFE